MRYFLIAASLIVAILLGCALLWISSRGGIDGVLEGYRDFSLSGQVVDSKGRPIDGVRIRSKAGRRHGLGTKEDIEIKMHDFSSSTFSLQFKARSRVSLEFMKAGYESAGRQFYPDTGAVHQNLRIVLFTKAEAAAQAATQPATPSPRVPSATQRTRQP